MEIGEYKLTVNGITYHVLSDGEYLFDFDAPLPDGLADKHIYGKITVLDLYRWFDFTLVKIVNGKYLTTI